jgi:tRNA U34 5-methylaminomethyl-2-thiouridine-forming methyltransferase MnmC
MVLKIVRTEDGTITCFDQATGELYHNRAGAYAEALVNFVMPSGLLEWAQSNESLSILDLPFGLGYNTFVFLEKLVELYSSSCCQSRGAIHPTIKLKQIGIVGLELDDQVMLLLEQVLADERFRVLRENVTNLDEVLSKLAAFQRTTFSLADWMVTIDCVRADIRTKVPEMVGDGLKFDAILHDPFSPRQMPELWSLDLFLKYRALLNDRGRMVTYSAAAAVRGALREAGFTVYRTQALGGKSGGTLAACLPLVDLADGVFHLTESQNAKLQSSSAIAYRDPQLCSARDQIWKMRKDQVNQISRNKTH